MKLIFTLALLAISTTSGFQAAAISAILVARAAEGIEALRP